MVLRQIVHILHILNKSGTIYIFALFDKHLSHTKLNDVFS